jgi:hypothetical protein
MLRPLPVYSHRNEIRPGYDFRPEFNLPSDSRFPGEISDLEDMDGINADRPRLNAKVIDKRGCSESTLPLLRRLQLRLLGYAYIGHRRQPEWKGALPFYAFRCGVHGLVEDYPHGYNKRLDCSLCLREDELIRFFDEREV